MPSFLPTIILRHRKENRKKCSLRGLESREDMHFINYPYKALPDLANYILLALDGEPLSEQDADKGLFLVDGTWKLSEVILKSLPSVSKRSLPAKYTTAYPRRQSDCADPSRGLASVEALFLAYMTMGKDPSGLLDQYYWKDQFLVANGVSV